jgi:hypothetical protein
MAKYQPGVCNIGKNEIRKRYELAAIVFVMAAIVSYLIFTFNLPKWTLFFSFILLTMGFEGFYQGYFRFCAGFAARGIYDFSGSGGSKSVVTNQESHEKDMGKARQIHLYSIISSIIIVAIIYFAL